jgi:pseudouridine synthase
MNLIRLQKFLSQAGVCSRRQAEVLIKQKQIKVNDQIAQLGDKVDPDRDKIEVKSKIVSFSPTKIYLLLNKPTGYVTTRSDRHAEKTIYDLLPKELKNQIWPVGRLDKNSSGLLILTNDGDLTQKLTHPSFEHEKEYLIRFRGLLNQEKIQKLQKGVTLNGQPTLPCQVKLIKPDEVKIILKEGQKRQIREMLKVVGCQITFLQRLRENKLKLSDLRVGQYKFITKNEIL